LEEKQNKIFYAISNFGIFLLFSFPATYMFHFLTGDISEGGLNFTLNEDAIRFLLISVGLIIGIFAGPLFGYLSDKTRTKWGKRRIWMAISSPLTGIFFILLTFPYSTNYDNAIIYLMLIYIIYSVCINALNTPYLGLMADITLPENRVKMSGTYGLFGGIGTALGLILPPIIILLVKSWLIVSLIYAIILIISNFITILMIKEPISQFEPAEEKIPFIEIIKNKKFIIFEICQFLWNMAFNLVLAALGPIAAVILGLPTEEEFGPFAGLLLGIIGIFFVVYLVKGDKWGKKRTMVFALIYTGIVFPFGSLFYFTRSFGYMLIQGLIFIVLIAVGLAAIFVFPMSIVMDLIKKKQEASYMGVNSIFMNLSGATGTMIMFFIISFFGMENAFYIICPILGSSLLVSGLIFKFVLKTEKDEIKFNK